MGATLVLEVAVILAISRVFGHIFKKLGQPTVVGEMFAGIFLGPSLLGAWTPWLSATIFPRASISSLAALSELGIVMFMFAVGLRTDFHELCSLGRTTILISHASIVIPFLFGSLLALYLYPRLSTADVSIIAFTLFLSAAMSITAFPVLSRILVERNLIQTRLGSIALACAAMDDVAGWCILSLIIVLVRHGQVPPSGWAKPLTLLISVFLIIIGVRPLLNRILASYRARGELSETMLGSIALLVLAMALFTEWAGIHLFLGGFIAGLIMPRDGRFHAYLLARFETLAVTLLVPVFFAVTGLRTSIGMIEGAEMWACCLLVIIVATAGKCGGCMAAATLAGMSREEACALSILLNTRGLMELIVLNIGLEMRIISPALFSMLVFMALFTTFLTTPVLGWITHHRSKQIASFREFLNRRVQSG